MESNHLVLLEKFLCDRRDQFGESIPDDELFELFSVEQILKDYDLSYEEIKDGIVDGGADGGVDAFYLFTNDVLVAEDTDLSAFGRQVRINLIIIQAKNSRNIREAAVDKLDHTIKDIFDFTKDTTSLRHMYNSHLLSKAGLFKKIYLQLLNKFPELNIEVYYVSKGGSPNQSHCTRSRRVTRSLTELFSDASVGFEFVGCSSLVSLTRRSTSTPLSLTFSDGPLATESGGLVGTVRLADYFKFISADGKKIRSGLFEFNVRDYQGRTEVNNAIRDTLALNEGGDFWWLNNGITIVCKRMNSSSKTVMLDDPQVVNGLQTSSEVFEYCRSGGDRDEKRSVLVRIIEPEDDFVRDRIIKATNSQTSIPGASLRATDPFQRDIEDYFLTNGYFYDRRKNLYKNQGKPINRIVGIPLLAQAVMAIVLSQPDNARARPTSLLNDDDGYREVFNPTYPLDTFLNCVRILHRVDEYLKDPSSGVGRDQRNNVRYHLAMLSAEIALGSVNVTAEEVAKLSENAITGDILALSFDLWQEEYRALAEESEPDPNQIAKSKDFVKRLKTRVSTIIGEGSFTVQ